MTDILDQMLTKIRRHDIIGDPQLATEIESLKSEILRRLKIVDKLEAILKTKCVEKNPECIFCKANPLLQQILKENKK